MSLDAVLNTPLETEFLTELVADHEDLRRMWPQASLPFEARQWFEKMSGGHSFKVLRENAVVGHFAFLKLNPSKREATLGLVYLAPALRGTGAAREMLALAEELAVEFLDLKALTLNVNAANLAAFNLYKKAGYREQLRDGETVRMHKILKA